MHVLFVVCDNEGVPNSADATRAPVGCKLHMDVNFKDANNHPVSPVGDITWSYSNPSLITVVDDEPWGPILRAEQRGTLVITAAADGVRSSPYSIEFY